MGCRPLPAQKKEPKDKASRPLEEEEKKKLTSVATFRFQNKQKTRPEFIHKMKKKCL